VTGESVARLERFGFPIASGAAMLHGVAFSADPRTGRRDWTRIETDGARTRQHKQRLQRARLKLAWLLTRQARIYPRATARMHQAMRQLSTIDLATRTNAELSELAKRIGDPQDEFGPMFQMATWTVERGSDHSSKPSSVRGRGRASAWRRR
jgi:hypothetical protein